MEEEVIETGRSKADAKTIVAKIILEQLSMRGYRVPAEFQGFKAINKLMEDAGLPAHSYVVLVNEFCKQFRLDPVVYDIMADPAGGQQSYTVKARIGSVERAATGPTKRGAQQYAAAQIYFHLRTRLRGTFNEAEVMYRAFEKACAPTSDEDSPGEQRDKEEEKQTEAARQKSRKKKNKKKTMGRVDLDETVRMELDISGNVSRDVGPEPSSSVTDEDADAEGGEAAGLPNELVPDHEIAMAFISRTMARLGI